MKIIVSEKSGKSYSINVEKDKEMYLYGKKIGDEVQGDDFGLAGYILKITGGSDVAGFPMRADISGNRRIKVLMKKGKGLRKHGKFKKNKRPHPGDKIKRMLRGNTIGEGITEVNMKVEKAGSIALKEILGKNETQNKDEGKEKAK